ncbi:MAG: iron chaperone [Myxococcaceae bacterium]
MKKPSSIDEYLATVSGDQRAMLDKLRKTIRELVPEAEECISYGIPAFRLKGSILAGFAVRTTGCSYYPFSGSTLRSLAEDLSNYETTKSALHFERPLPKVLVRKLLKARLAQTEQ